jgi:integrase
MIDVPSLRCLFTAMVGWLDRQQQEALAYLIEENRILRGHLRGRWLRLCDDERRRLAVRGHRLGRRGLRQRATYTHGTKAGQRITESGFNKAWRKARVAAGGPGRIPHDFRRTAVRNLVQAGVPERVAMQLTGHKTRAVFERYNIVSSGDLRRALELPAIFVARVRSGLFRFSTARQSEAD